MHVIFHTERKNLQCSLSEERTIKIDGLSYPYRILTLDGEDQYISIFMTTQQVYKLMAALAEGLQKEPEEKPSEETNNECSGQ